MQCMSSGAVGPGAHNDDDDDDDLHAFFISNVFFNSAWALL